MAWCGDLAEMGRVTERGLDDGSCVCWKPSLQPRSVQRWRYVPGGSTLVPLFPILAFLFFLSIYLSICLLYSATHSPTWAAYQDIYSVDTLVLWGTIMTSVVTGRTFHSPIFYPTKTTAVSCKGTPVLFFLCLSWVLSERKIKPNEPGLYPTHCLASLSFLLEGGD